MKANPTPEHEWLMQMVGEWTSRSTCQMPDGSTNTSEGRETVRAVGEVWVVGEGETVIEGARVTSVITLGYDPAMGRYVGSWIGSPMTTFVSYEGVRAASGALPLDCTAPDLEDPTKRSAYQDIIEIRGPDERAMISQIQNADGTWTLFMEAVYRRVRQPLTSC
ncbi:MAG: DUF1579 domain-containing protein [Planctomycetota bacterium]